VAAWLGEAKKGIIEGLARALAKVWPLAAAFTPVQQVRR